jgi:outer membrane protein TolC
VACAVLFAVLSGAGLAGCAGLSAIDKKIDRLIEERSNLVGVPRAPSREYDDAKSYKTDGQYDLEPPTVNPSPEELDFKAADPDRDAGQILDDYARQAAGIGTGQEPIILDLVSALRIAQESGRDFLNAEEEYILAAIRLLIERHQWGPRFFNDVSAAVSGSGDDGDFDSALRVVNDLRVTKRLRSGGDVEARLLWEATEQLREGASGEYEQSASLIFSGDIPLLRGAGPAARESLIQAERDLIYAARDFERFRREFLVDIAEDYFGLLEAKAGIANQKRNIRNLADLLRERVSLEQKGRISEFDVNNTLNDLGSAQSRLNDLIDGYTRQLELFKIRLGIDVETPVRVTRQVLDLTEPDISLAEAVDRAYKYRLDLQNRRDELDDSRRNVAIARNNILPDLDFNADLQIPTDPRLDEGGLNFSSEDLDYSVGVTFGLPLDREQERLRLRQAILGVERSIRELQRFEDTIFVEARSSVRAIEVARTNLRISEQRVRITLRRQKEQQIKADEITTQERLDTEAALLDALNERDSDETNLRTSILEYLLETGQMRVTRVGEMAPLPGMDLVPVTLFEDVDDLDEWYIDALEGVELPDLSEYEGTGDEDQGIGGEEQPPEQPGQPGEAPPPAGEGAGGPGDAGAGDAGAGGAGAGAADPSGDPTEDPGNQDPPGGAG